jgi:predicted Zn-dependent protease
VRVAVALVAVVVLAWLGVMYRDAHLQARGVARVQSRDLAAAEADLRAARLLNPDRAPDVTRAVIYRARGDNRRAIALLDDVVRREPHNLSAWAVMRLSATGTDPDAFRRSLTALQRLDPVNVPRPSPRG